MKKPKRPKDPNQLANAIVKLATGQASEPAAEYDSRNRHAVALGRLGGLKGGKARAKVLSASQRSQIAKKAAKARWKKRSKKQ